MPCVKPSLANFSGEGGSVIKRRMRLSRGGFSKRATGGDEYQTLSQRRMAISESGERESLKMVSDVRRSDSAIRRGGERVMRR